MPFVTPQLAQLVDSPDIVLVHGAVQRAIELEHSTIPAYLYALYSLGSSNMPAQVRLRSIVIDEMLHMLLACNLLNAIGGSPRIDDPNFVPTYPAPLPGTVQPGLSLGLKRYSIELVKDTFMELERSEHPLKFPENLVQLQGITIGQFYARLKKRLETCEFDTSGAKQVSSDRFAMPASEQMITNFQSASRAIDYIVTQGEGNSSSPVAGRDWAHYYRLAELACGRRLVPNPDAGPDAPANYRYHYAGELLPFDAEAVLPFPENPKLVDYPEESEVRKGVEHCNRLYTTILRLLHGAVNGQKTNLDAAIGSMGALRMRVQLLAAKEVDGKRGVPTFEYTP